MVKTYLPTKSSEEKEEINENLELRGGGGFKKKTAQKRNLCAVYMPHTQRPESFKACYYLSPYIFARSSLI